MIQQDETINEVWRSISGYINYQVSSIGRVRNAETGNVLKNYIRSKYYAISLWKDGVMTKHQIHTLVAQEFLDKPEVDYQLVIDHKDRNKLNNQISNLRYVSLSQNQMNSGKRLNTSSKFKGVHWDKSKKTWRAYIGVNKTKLYLGCYENEVEAARVYNTKAVELFGEYACLNELDDYDDDDDDDDDGMSTKLT